jgi:FdhE protein
VASGFFRKLLGSRDRLPRAFADAIAELDELARTRPSLADSARMLRDILPALHDDTQPTPHAQLTAESAHARLADGIPLLRGLQLDCDAATLRERWLAVCAAVERHPPGKPASALIRAVRTGAVSVAELLMEVLAGRPEGVASRAETLGIDAPLTATILRLTCLPLLAAVAAGLEPLRRQCAWDHGFCPVCGSWPLLGEFRGLEQARTLRCGVCAASWDFPRIRCPFCDTHDPHQLGYLHAEGEQDRWRAATCDACRGYVKMVACLDALPLPRLLVTDVATMHLDLAAADRGHFVG